ncbi:MAG: hypothetical protein CEN87_341 [Parcubacteria group bacterium Licking1014_1]|nr:MAG: hypothetical protein CEN87_341 [Parcubacteria group bacterium Licking1014_1]
MPNRIVIGGPMNCGKSTLAASIYCRLKTIGVGVGLYEIDVFSDTIPCILGIKPWEQRQKRKSGNWDDPLINLRLNDFSEDKNFIVLGDLPGLIDGLLERMVRPATAAIAMGKNQESLQRMLEFFEYQRISVILKIISLLDDNALLQISFSDILFVRNLKRKVLQNDEICQVVNRLLTLCEYTG